jgi:hypothetical protein
VAIVLVPSVSRPQPPPADPFALFGSAIRLTASDRRDLRAGRTIVHIVEQSEKSHVGVFVAARIDVTPSRFAERVSDSASLWKGQAVPATGTFSSPPGPGDVAAMQLPRKDVDSLPDCRPGSCAVKLTAEEIQHLRDVIAREPAQWREQVQEEFRRIATERVRDDERGGLGALKPFRDHGEPVNPAAVFARLLQEAAALRAHDPSVWAYLERHPHEPLPPGAHGHLYWLSTDEPPRTTSQAMHVLVALHQRLAGNHGAPPRPGGPVRALHGLPQSLRRGRAWRVPVGGQAVLHRAAHPRRGEGGVRPPEAADRGLISRPTVMAGVVR